MAPEPEEHRSAEEDKKDNSASSVSSSTPASSSQGDMDSPSNNISGNQTMDKIPEKLSMEAPNSLDRPTTTRVMPHSLSVSASNSAQQQQQQQQQIHLPKPLVVGGITGRRSTSGTVTLTGSFDQAIDQQRVSAQENATELNRDRANTAPSWIPESDVPTTEPAPQQISPTPSAGAEEDEEIKLAMAMALAIQQNPHLTPYEIHELLGQQQKPMVAASQKPASTLIPGRLSSLFVADSAKKTDKFIGNFREKAWGFMATNTSPVAPASAEATNSLSPTEANTLKLPFRTASPEVDPSIPTSRDTAPPPPPPPPPVPPVTQSDSTTWEELPPSADADLAPSLTSGPAALTDMVKQVAAIPYAVPDVLSSAMTTAVEKAMDAATASPKASRGPTNRHGKMFQKLKTSTSSSNKSLSVQSLPPPRLTGIAWKRRGGMGKYSTTSAWERRRIALQGTKLVYYQVEEEHHPITVVDDGNLNDNGAVSLRSESSEKKLNTGNWFENTAYTWPFVPNAADPSPDAPRGYIDLAKEKATVHAAFGHSGAPTPFALSIKIKGETKWKLCFDRHASEMEWLSAITDVVVQTSVDSYNANLLEAADPSNQFDFALFQPPTTADGAAVKDEPERGKGHRLWMLEKYRVCSQPDLGSMSLDDDEACTERSGIRREGVASADENNIFQPTPMLTTTLVSDEAADADARAHATEESNKTWVVPEDRLRYILALLNFGILYARSSIGVDAFWLLVVFANFGFYRCLVQQPDWKSLLGAVQAMPKILQTREANASTRDNTAEILKPALRANTVGAISVVSAVPATKRASYVPKAGCTSVKLAEPTDPPKNDKGEMFAGWRTMPGDILAVRSHGYAASKAKVPSPGELYECVNMDVFESPSRYPDMAKRVELPKIVFDDEGVTKTWRCPDIFIVSIALPTDTPKIGRSSSDGSGYTITMYYRMKQETRDILKRVTADDYDPSKERLDDPQTSKVNAVRLLEEWIRRAPTDEQFQARFKIVPNAHNLKEIGMPAWIAKYNGKPFLIKRAGVTGFLHVHPELSCVEFDVSLHPFPYLAKQGICFMKESYFKRVLVTFGFVIEGRADDEVRF